MMSTTYQDEDVYIRVRGVICDAVKICRDSISHNTELGNFWFDSLGLLELYTKLEEEFPEIRLVPPLDFRGYSKINTPGKITEIFCEEFRRRLEGQVNT